MSSWGSAPPNLNHRSLGYDSECDLAIEAADEATRSRIAAVRNRVLAEHLMRPQEEIARAIAEAGLIAAIERLNQGGGRFQPYRIEPDAGPKEPFPGTGLLDPAEPLDLDYLRRWLQHLLVAD
jgi:phosphatidylserine/phosphatidylglycerophosphate/cardiolipin synthase-like enzyme